MALFDPSQRLPRSTYFVSVLRQPKRRIELTPISLRERLPAVRLPLRDEDDDVLLDVQALVDEAFHSGRYDTLDYAKPCAPPLNTEDAGLGRGRRPEWGAVKSS